MSEIDKNFSYTDRAKEYMRKKQGSDDSHDSSEQANEPEKISPAPQKGGILFPKKSKNSNE